MHYDLSELNEKGVPPLLQEIETEEEWKAKRKDIMNRWFEYIGEIPDPVDVNVEFLSETNEGDYIRQHIAYDSIDGDRITAYLLIPQAALDNQAQAPAVMALHGTTEIGKDSIATEKGKKNRNYGPELAARGYVVLVPDALTAGERIYDGYNAYDNAPFYERYPEWSAVAKNIVDHRQGLELLCQLDFVNPEALGAIGHSFGGYNSYYLGIWDRRIKAVVSSCGFSTFTGDATPEQWGVRDWYTHMPKISDSLAKGRIPFEFHEILALVAPTPLFNWSGQSDHIFPHWPSIGSGLHEVYKLYEWLGIEDRFVSLLGASGHDFPPYIRQMAYDFLDQWLKN